MVWQKENWDRLRAMPADLNPTDATDAKAARRRRSMYTPAATSIGPASSSQRTCQSTTSACRRTGFTPADGTVLEGKVVDLAAQKPLAAARVKLELIEPQAKGGYKYTVAAEAACDTQGHWLLKKVPAGWYRVIVDADGFVPRLAAHAQFDDQPRWHSYDSALARPRQYPGAWSMMPANL